MKKKIDFLLTGLCLLVVYKLSPLWNVVELKIIKPLLPFFISFIIAYFLYPLKQFFKVKFGSRISMFLIILIIILIICSFIFLLVPLFYKESIFLINTIYYFVKSISIKFNIDLSVFTNKLVDRIDFVSSYNSFLNIFVIICLTIYLLMDMEKIRKFVYDLFKDKEYFCVISESDKKIKKYIKSILIISGITFFEYFIFYSIIKHPNALLLCFLASILNVIPYFGGIIFGLIALLSSQSRVMVIKCIIVIFITSILDTYVINPLSFKKSNDISPIISIIGVLLFGSLFGTIGIVLALPILIFLREFIDFIKKK